MSESLPFPLLDSEEPISIEQAITKLVSDFISVPFWRFKPQDDTLPVVVYELVRSEYDNYLVGKAGLAHSSIEFKIISRSYDEVISIAKELRTVLDGFDGTINNRTILSSLHTSEHDECEFIEATQKPIYCRVQEYEILYLE